MKKSTKLFSQINSNVKDGKKGFISCGGDDACVRSDGFCAPWAH